MPLIQMTSMRWFVAELIVIVLGITIAFQVEEWRQDREELEQQHKAFLEVLLDLDSVEFSVNQALQSVEASTEAAINLVALIQSGSEDEAAYLKHIFNMRTYLLGVTSDSTAYEGLFKAGRFAGVDDQEALHRMRLFFTITKPWIMSLNDYHISRFNDLKEILYLDLRRVPDEDFATTVNSRWEFRVPPSEFPSDPQGLSEIIGFISSSQRIVGKYQRLLRDIATTRESIETYLEGRSLDWSRGDFDHYAHHDHDHDPLDRESR